MSSDVRCGHVADARGEQVLFDLALNKAEYPDLAKRCEKKKAGIMGWFGRN
jgi:hypothetical protein